LIIGFLFFLWTALYVEISRLSSHFLVGMLLPLGAWITRMAALFLLCRSCHSKYFLPKARSLEPIAAEQCESEGQSMPPPLLGDLELIYGYLAALFALLIGCGSYAPMLVQVMNNPSSLSWITGIVASLVLEITDRTSINQRVQLRVASYFKLERIKRLIKMSAFKMVYYRSQFTTEFAAPILATSIGCLRALLLWDIRAIVWLDVNPTVVWVIVSHLLSKVLVVELTVWVAEYKRFTHFEFVTCDLAPHHPIGNVELRPLDTKGYVFVSIVGCTFTYAIFLCFLGPGFVTGIARTYDPNNLGAWVYAPQLDGPSGLNFTNTP
jgi:hypothetical protein